MIGYYIEAVARALGGVLDLFHPASPAPGDRPRSGGGNAHPCLPAGGEYRPPGRATVLGGIRLPRGAPRRDGDGPPSAPRTRLHGRPLSERDRRGHRQSRPGRAAGLSVRACGSRARRAYLHAHPHAAARLSPSVSGPRAWACCRPAFSDPSRPERAPARGHLPPQRARRGVYPRGHAPRRGAHPIHPFAEYRRASGACGLRAVGFEGRCVFANTAVADHALRIRPAPSRHDPGT